MSLYDDLNVPADADAATIKKAYRKKASKAHPDKEGGSNAEFQKIHHAYKVLSDHSKRTRYDQTGQDDARADEKKRMVEGAVGLFLRIVDDAENMESVNIMEAMRITLRTLIKDDRQRIVQGNRIIVRLESVKRRIVNKGKGEDIFTVALGVRIHLMQQQIAEIEETIAFNTKMIEFIRDFDYVTDLPSSFAAGMLRIKGGESYDRTVY